MQKIPQITIYAKKAGVAITPFERRSEARPAEGRIVLRFFRLESGSSAIRFIVEPAEAFALYDKMCRIVRDGGRESLTHAFAGPEGEVQTRLTVECWVRNDKSGYALSVQRDEEQINVPVPSEKFLYVAEFLRHLSLQQAWVEEVERPAE
ncbi:MAG TPA: hypothetical protein VJ910_04800 [Desulfuromonadales bacterium]|nr:hypothetical protein [Desulfuromonadales bacterium]